MTDITAAANRIRDWADQTNDPINELASLPAEDPVSCDIAAVADAADSDDEAVAAAGIRAVFASLVEAWNDRFSAHGRRCYGAVFGHMTWRILSRREDAISALKRFGITSAHDLIERWQRVRHNRDELPEKVERVIVLSRVTLGADILLTSVVVQRARACWPDAKVVVVGDPKLDGLLGGMDHLRIDGVSYARRGRLGERLGAWLEVLHRVDALAPDVVISPDSRLDQLGLLPVCPDDSYRLWENLEDEQHPRSLADLLDDWCRHIMPQGANADVRPCVHFPESVRRERQRLMDALGSRPIVAVKLDHGGNPAKALPEEGAKFVLEEFRNRGWRILLDRGFGPTELQASDDLLDRLGWTAVDIDDSGRPELGQPVAELGNGSLVNEPVIRFHGSIAGWAAAVSCCGLAFSYDSVGHHLAAALGVPLLVAFTGHDHEVFPIAWGPRGNGPIDQVVIPTDRRHEPDEWKRLCDHIISAA